MNCKNCGNDVRADAAFCTSCGTRIETGPAPAESVTVETTTVENVIPETGATETVTTTTVTTETETFETIENNSVKVDPQTPCVSSIPAPPQMPDLPAPPALTPNAYAPPPPYSAPPQTPYSAPPVPGPQAPDTQTTESQVPNTYTPVQQYYQQPYQQTPDTQTAWGVQPPAQTPWVPPAPAGPKKVNKGLVIGLIAGGVVLLAAAIIIGLFVGRIFQSALEDVEQALHDMEQSVVQTPNPLPPLDLDELVPQQSPRPDVPETPPPPPPPPSQSPPFNLVSDNELVGMWELDSGDPLWFFGVSELIMIVEHDDGTFGIFESGSEEWGILHIIDDERLLIEGEWSGDYDFTYRLDGNRLTIIDVDGDEAHFEKLE